MKAPLGMGLLLTGSGIYWMMSASLISSFTVLAPDLFRSAELGRTAVLCTGVICATMGLWIVPADLQNLSALFRGRQGWLFTIPLLLVASDLVLTVAGMSRTATITELNPFVDKTVQLGPVGVWCYAISYSILSVGIALMMNQMGHVLFEASESLKLLPFSMVCGAASFGTISNAYLILEQGPLWIASLVGSAGAVLLSTTVFYFLKRTSSKQFPLWPN